MGRGSEQISRRALLASAIGAGVGASTMGVSGCARLGKTIHLRYWNGFTGPDGRTMLAMVRKFNEKHPDIQVQMQRMDWGTFYNKLFVAGLGGRAPEIFVIHSRALLRFARAGFARPLDSFVATGDSQALPGDLSPNVWRAARVDGKHYGLPLDVHAMGMYYNRKLFSDAGLNPDAPPTDTAGFLDAIRRINGKTRDGLDRWGFVFTNLESNCYTLVKQFGGAIFSDDGARCVLNNPQNVEALTFARALIADKLVPSPENIDAWVGLRQGRIGMAWEGIYMLASLQTQKDLDFAGAPVPIIGPKKAVWADSHNLCIRANLPPDIDAAAWTFLRFLSDNSLDWADGGQIPTRISLQNAPRFAKMSVQSQFARQIEYVEYLPQVPFVFEYQTEFGLAVEKALRGRATPAQALAVAEANVNKILERERSYAREASA